MFRRKGRTRGSCSILRSRLIDPQEEEERNFLEGTKKGVVLYFDDEPAGDEERSVGGYGRARAFKKCKRK